MKEEEPERQKHGTSRGRALPSRQLENLEDEVMKVVILPYTVLRQAVHSHHCSSVTINLSGMF